MNSPFPILIAATLAFGVMSCHTQQVGYVPGAGYSPRDAYERGFSDGSGDRLAGKTHNPHINRSDTLPSAHRTQYIWGYNEGYKAPYSRLRHRETGYPSK